MAVISEVKCGRCDRRYSGFRSRCPYCGARRNKRGKHAEDTENKKAKLIIGVILLLVLIGATIVLIIASGAPKGTGTPKASASASSIKPTNPNDENVVAVSGSASPLVSPGASPSASIDPNVKISDLKITYNGTPTSDATMGKIGSSEQFGFQTTPATTNKVPIWKSSDNNIFTVIDGKVIANGKGTATLTVKVDEKTAECIIRVRGS